MEKETFENGFRNAALFWKRSVFKTNWLLKTVSIDYFVRSVPLTNRTCIQDGGKRGDASRMRNRRLHSFNWIVFIFSFMHNPLTVIDFDTTQLLCVSVSFLLFSSACAAFLKGHGLNNAEW